MLPLDACVDPDVRPRWRLSATLGKILMATTNVEPPVTSIDPGQAALEQALVAVARLAGIDPAKHRPFVRLMSAVVGRPSTSTSPIRKRVTRAGITAALASLGEAIATSRRELRPYLVYPPAQDHDPGELAHIHDAARTMLLIAMGKGAASIDVLDADLLHMEGIVDRARAVAAKFPGRGRRPENGDLRLFLTSLAVTVDRLGGRLPHSADGERLNSRCAMAQALDHLRPHCRPGFLPAADTSPTLLRLLNEARRQANAIGGDVVGKARRKRPK
jgi:hypothetical protein